MTHLQLEAEPDTSFAGDFIVTVCVGVVFFAGFYLGWTVFLAILDALS